MPRPIVPAGIEIVLEATQEGNLRQHVIHASAGSSTPTAPELQGAAHALAEAVRAHLAMWASTVSFQKVTATDISQLDGQQYVEVFTSPTVGANTNQSLPGNVAAVTSFTSTHGGRVGHGRVYNFGLCTNFIVNGSQIVASGVAGYNTLWGEVDSNLTAAGTPHCVFSRKNLALYPVQGISTDNNVDSQRRRLNGRGR